jgi:hypothetical protein
MSPRASVFNAKAVKFTVSVKIVERCSINPIWLESFLCHIS